MNEVEPKHEETNTYIYIMSLLISNFTKVREAKQAHKKRATQLLR